MIKPNKINSYIAQRFIVKFLQIILGFALLIFFINLLESSDKIRGQENASFLIASKMALFQIPSFIDDVVPSLVLIAAIITFLSLSSKSEITVIRASGFSLWQILRPIALTSFILGIFWILVFQPLAIKMLKNFNQLENKYVKAESREVVIIDHGIWLRQPNMTKAGEQIIIQAKKIYHKNLEFNGVTIWFFNENNQFYKKIDTNKMLLKNKYWHIENAIINDKKTINQHQKNIKITTDLEADFIMKKIVNNFQNVKSFSVIELPKLITDLKSSGFNSTKFYVYFNYLLNLPFLFIAMSMIACYFGLDHIRNKRANLKIFLGIIIGLLFYIFSNIMNSFGSSGLISPLASTWIVTAISLSIGTLLIYRKESL